MLSTKYSRLEKSYVFLFIGFTFFSAIFCNISKVNLLFHASVVLFVITMIVSHYARNKLIEDANFLKSLILPGIFLLYFSLTNLWSDNPGNIISTLKHALYLMAFICLYRQAEILGYKNHIMAAVFFGMTILSILTLLIVDKTHLSYSRLSDGFRWAPDNVIDLGGYMAIGVFCGLIYIRESGKTWLYLFFPVLLTSLLLTQSRGPLVALAAAFILLFLKNPRYSRKHIVYGFAIIIIIALIVHISGFTQILINRLGNSYQQSFVRFGIWQHAIEIAKEKPILGWGYDKSLVFVNSIGQNITTTHTIYLSSFLKGGIIGFILLMSVIGCGLSKVGRHLKANHKTEVAIFIFSLIYYMTQGMFIIGNPQEFWFLFWFPLAVILSTPAKEN
jgi:O-antigen ligase